jgi:hypothetical protein
MAAIRAMNIVDAYVMPRRVLPVRHAPPTVSSRIVKASAVALLLVALFGRWGPDNLPLYDGGPADEGRFSLLMGIDRVLQLEGDCLVLAAEPGSVLLIWPTPGTQWDPTTRTVTLDGTSAQIGDRVAMGDYLGGQPPEDGWADWVNKPSADCQYPLAMVVRLMYAN